jgi:AcrR family transcriptional regulator
MKKTSNVAARQSPASPTRRRKYDPQQTRRNILEFAREEFAALGLTGARIDAIALRTNTTKCMSYYYFGSKEGLYLAVLEQAYGDIRALEQGLHPGEMDPRKGVCELVQFTFDHHDEHHEFVRPIAIENIHCAKYVKQAARSGAAMRAW